MQKLTKGTKVVTNYHWRPLVSTDAVPQDVLNDKFDYHNADDVHQYVKYCATWYCLDEFTRTTYFGDSWHGYLNDSMCSGILVRFPHDDDWEHRDCVRMGWFCS